MTGPLTACEDTTSDDFLIGQDDGQPEPPLALQKLAEQLKPREHPHPEMALATVASGRVWLATT